MRSYMRGLVCASEGRTGSSGQSCQVGVGCHPQLTNDRNGNGKTGPDSLHHRPQTKRWYTEGRISASWRSLRREA
jgi:hypothetical protein